MSPLPLSSLLLALSFWLTTSKTEPSSPQIDRIVYAMGTRLEISALGTSRQTALQASERAVVAIRETESLLSTWSQTSEISQLGRGAADSVLEISPRLSEVLGRVEQCRLATHGAFSLTPDQFGPSFRKLSGRSFKRLGNGAFDSGAFGKGEALDEATASFFKADGMHRIQLNFGGQITVATKVRTEIMVDLAHPLDRGQPALRLNLEAHPQLSIATSGNSERGQNTPTIRDPQTGDAAEDFGSLTVVARSSFEADCLSTGLFVLGPETALAFAEAHPHIGVIVLEIRERDLIARTAGALPGSVTAVAPTLRIVPFEPSDRQSDDLATRRSQPTEQVRLE